MGQFVGVLELERHECGDLWSADIFPIEKRDRAGLNRLMASKRRVRALLAQEPGRCCLQESEPIYPSVSRLAWKKQLDSNGVFAP